MSDDLYRALGRIEGAMEAIKKDTSEIKETLDNHSKRLGVVEGFKTQVLAIAGVVGAGVSVVWDVIKTKFGA